MGGHQCSAHHSPIFGPVAIAAWWFRGTFERARREGLQSIIDGRDAQIAGLNMQIAVAQERLRLANDLQEYASTKFSDAEKEAAKLKQQIDEASPESIALTANYTVAMISRMKVFPILKRTDVISAPTITSFH